MPSIIDHRRVPSRGPRLVTLVAIAVALSACSSAAVPAPSVASPPPSTPAIATPVVTPSTEPSVAASPSPAIIKVTPLPGAPDSKITLQLVASHTKWIPVTLNAPAGKTWHVKIDDQDAVIKHNFTVASGKTFEERIYQAKNFLKGSHTFDIPGLPAGHYLFICTIHPESMTGTLNVE